VYTLEGHKSRIVSLNFDITYRKLISLGRDKTVKIWDFDKITEV
jgi:WD40 repeat protein